MKFSVRLFCGALLLVSGLLPSGCLPPGQGQSDEEKEPHFLAGKGHVKAMDYAAAIESFEKALEVNPRSAAAHFELGLLYENNQHDYAAAIYHFERFLQLRLKPEYGDEVKGRIIHCKQELAKTVSLGPVTQTLQGDLERLAEENKRLRAETAKWREEAEKWRACVAALPAAQTNRPTEVPRNAEASASSQRLPGGVAPSRAAASAHPTPPPSQATARTYVVRPGDTLAAIARHCGVRLSALQAANPRLDARRLQPGQTIVLPSP
jgi:tetratricopeptide (TPR) repeat protein